MGAVGSSESIRVFTPKLFRTYKYPRAGVRLQGADLILRASGCLSLSARLETAASTESLAEEEEELVKSLD